MKLWIRSQDRMTLCKCNNIYIDDEWVSPYYIKDDTLTLGKYLTKERALEVLDEIQNILETRNDVSQMVYEMPKE
jgi:hypothetical protein